MFLVVVVARPPKTPKNKVTPHETTRAIAVARFKAKWQFYKGRTMISELLVLVLGDIVAQPRKFSVLAFAIVLPLELVFFGVFASARARFCI